MRILFDENMPEKIVEGIKSFTLFINGTEDYEITSIHTLGMTGALDEQVLELVGKKGILVSYDKDFKKHKKLKNQIAKNKIGVFWLKQDKKPNFFNLAKFLINNWESMLDKISDNNRPFIFQVLKNSISEIHLG